MNTMHAQTRDGELATVTPRPLRVLIIEDSPDDAELLVCELEEGGYAPQWERVETAAALTSALARQAWDVIISDYSLPFLDGITALQLVQHAGINVPFIIVSGTIGEETAVRAMKAGAHDYIMKGHVRRLLPAVERELQESEVRRQRQRAEMQRAALLEVSKDIAGVLDFTDLLERVQRRTAELLPCDVVLTFGLHRDDDVIQFLAGHGLPPEQMKTLRAMEFPTFKPAGGRLGASETIVLNEIAAQPWLPAELCRDCGFTAMIAAPLRAKTRHFGTLLVCNADPARPFQPPQVELFEGIARQLAVAMEAAELYCVLQDQAEVSGAVARAGAELYGSLEAPVVRHQVCRIMTEALRCDRSHTILWEPNQHGYVPVAYFGHSPEAWQATRLLSFTPDEVAPLMALLEQQAAVPLATDASVPEMAALATQLRIRSGLALALRCGEELIGFQVVGHSRSAERCSAKHIRIATGIARIASVALANARMVEELEKANRRKAEIVGTMTHSLREPLQSIIGYTDLVRHRELGPLTTAQVDALQRVEENACTLVELLSSAVDLSALDFETSH